VVALLAIRSRLVGRKMAVPVTAGDKIYFH
jgi:hypothetical protein